VPGSVSKRSVPQDGKFDLQYAPVPEADKAVAAYKKGDK
jgi:hypothetical protein